MIHFVAVPGIYWTVLGLLWALPGPQWMPSLWLAVVFVAAMLFYLRLSLSLALGVLVLTSLMWWAIELLARSGWLIWQLSLVVFVVLWALQFIGHAVEGKRPSFFKDVQFLLIGPLWILAFVYRKLGIRY